MKKLASHAFLLFALTSILSCDDPFDCVRGEGPKVTRTLSLADIHSVEINGSHKAFIRQGESQEIVVVGQDNIINLLNHGVREGKWKIDIRQCTRRHDDLVFYITLPEIYSLSVNGSGDIIGEEVLEGGNINLNISGSGSITAELAADEVTSKISGSGDIKLKGAAINSAVTISGSGNYQAYGLEVANADINIKGSGNASVSVSDKLNAKISGSGKIYYKGNPIVNSSISGSGKVINKN